MSDNDKLILSLLQQMNGVFEAQRAYFDDAKKTGIRGAANPLYTKSVELEKAMKERIRKGLLYYQTKEKLAPFGAE